MQNNIPPELNSGEADSRTPHEEYVDAVIENRKNSGLYEDDCVTLKPTTAPVANRVEGVEEGEPTLMERSFDYACKQCEYITNANKRGAAILSSSMDYRNGWNAGAIHQDKIAVDRTVEEALAKLQRFVDYETEMITGNQNQQNKILRSYCKNQFTAAITQIQNLKK